MKEAARPPDIDRIKDPSAPSAWGVQNDVKQMAKAYCKKSDCIESLKTLCNEVVCLDVFVPIC